MKILVSGLRHDGHEVQILEHLSHGPDSHPGKKHIIQLLDHFEHEGPMVPTRASSSSPLGQVLCPRPSYIQVVDCLASWLGSLRGRLYKHLLISMPTVSHTVVSCDSATDEGAFPSPI